MHTISDIWWSKHFLRISISHVFPCDFQSLTNWWNWILKYSLWNFKCNLYCVFHQRISAVQNLLLLECEFQQLLPNARTWRMVKHIKSKNSFGKWLRWNGDFTWTTNCIDFSNNELHFTQFYAEQLKKKRNNRMKLRRTATEVFYLVGVIGIKNRFYCNCSVIAINFQHVECFI